MEGSFSFGSAPQLLGTGEATLMHLLDHFPGMFFKCKNDENWTILLLSKGCELLSGFSEKELKEKNKNGLLGLIHPEDRENVLRFRENLFQTKTAQTLEYRIVCKDGNEKFVREHAIGHTLNETGEQCIEGHLKDLSEWKKQENSIKKEQAYTQKIIGRMSEGFIMTDPSGKVTRVNDALCQLTGFSKEELINSTAPYPFWAPEHLEEIIDSFQQAWEGKKTECQLIFRKKNGERFNARVRPSSVQQDDGTLEFFFATINDVSIEMEFRKKVVESEHWLNEAQRIANMGNWEFNPKTNEVKWSKNAFHIYEYPEESKIPHYDWFMQKLHPDDVVRVKEAYDEAVQFKSNYDSMHRLVFDSGYVKWVREIGEIIYDDKGEPEIVIGTVTDITPQKQIEEQLKLYQYAIDSAITGIAMGDLNGKITFVNDAFREMFGFDQASEIIGKNPEDLIAGKNKNKVIPHILQKGAWKGEILAKRKNETTFICEMVANVARNEFGHPIGLFASFQDITDRIKTHEALRKSELNLKIMFNSNPSPMVVSRLEDGLMLLGNEALEKTFLVKPEDYIGKPTTLFYVDPNDRVKFVKELQQRGEVKGMELKLKRKNGQPLICSVSSEVIHLFKEKVLLSTLTDITEIKRNQLKLAESEQRLNLAQRIAKIGWWEFDAKSGSLIWSEELYSIFELSPSLEGNALLQARSQRISPKHFEPLMHKFNKALNEGTNYSIEHDIVLEDGSIKTLFCTGLAEKNDDGITVKIFGTAQDITRQNIAEKALLESQAFNVGILSSLNSQIALIDKDGTILTANNAWINAVNHYPIFSNFQIGANLFESALTTKSDVAPGAISGIISVLRKEVHQFHLEYSLDFGEEEHWFLLVATGYESEQSKAVVRNIDITSRKNGEKLILRSAVEAEEKERERLSRELHDGILQNMVGLSMFIHSLEQIQDVHSDEYQEIVGQLKTMVKQTIEETRMVSHDLMPRDLREHGLVDAVQRLINRLNRVDRIRYGLEVVGTEHKKDPLININLYRVVQEFVKNSQKYSEAEHVQIKMIFHADKSEYILSDNGIGFEWNQRNQDGIGIRNITSRINSINGTYQFQTAPGQGVVLKIEIKK